MDSNGNNKSIKIGLEYIEKNFDLLRNEFNDLRKDLNKYVTRMEFEARLSPIRAVIYGGISLILTIVGSAIIYSVIK